jgi:hypothetical protein
VEAARSSEMLVSTSDTVRFHNPKDRKLNFHRRENLNPDNFKTYGKTIITTNRNKRTFLLFRIEELRMFHSLPNIIMVIRSRQLRRARHVARMGEMQRNI